MNFFVKIIRPLSYLFTIILALVGIVTEVMLFVKDEQFTILPLFWIPILALSTVCFCKKKKRMYCVSLVWFAFCYWCFEMLYVSVLAPEHHQIIAQCAALFGYFCLMLFAYPIGRRYRKRIVRVENLFEGRRVVRQSGPWWLLIVLIVWVISVLTADTFLPKQAAMLFYILVVFIPVISLFAVLSYALWFSITDYLKEH